MNIPLVDLKAQYHSIKAEIDAAIARVLESSAFIMGKEVADFEAAYADYCGAKHAIGVANGTDALLLALQALGVGRGDEVITTPHTFIATVEPIIQLGARPVFVDIDPRTYNLDATRLEAAITERTKAIIPVHLYGQPSNMLAIKAVADRYSVPIIEDAAQAHGGRYGGERVGSWGVMTGFSFYPGKNLGAYGDAGAIITNDDALAARLRLLREHGSKTKYEHAIVGMNSRLDGLQAAILKVKLSHLSAWTEARRERAKRYGELLATIPGLILPWEDPNAHHVYHLYVVQVPVDRDALLSVLQKRGVGVGIHYPTPLHLQPALAEYGGQMGDYPIAESVARRIISLPLYPELRDDQMQFICDMLGEALLALASGVR